MEQIQINLIKENESQRLTAPLGANLREVLLERKIPLYEGRFEFLNCRGLGICGTCKVHVQENGQLWQRRACQITCSEDIEVHLGVN